MPPEPQLTYEAGRIACLETERLILRQWRDSDFPAFAKINADVLVMKHFPAVLSQAESDALAKRIQSLIAENGWGFWAVEYKETGDFLGFVGLHRQAETSALPFAPCVEIGWRLASPCWGKGIATEAARAALHFAFAVLDLRQVLAFTALTNQPSQRVMSKLGMQNCHADFLHPALPEGHPLQCHCLYHITREQWHTAS
ncbi:GNAT family N-acetyltransferase [Vibrio fluvialis]|uniref:GNAT family N-acetyltransferase n=1 Tax=Vibrio TaxID=662 RepID=UPI0018F1FCD7|nr:MULTISPECIES: GNAT family N-acetyltransferase [Vibrio]EKO3399863.1 GNAT family N-acetyltransferase [Vibrio fluvialis]MBY8116323.1 GNAT family N-acetyltransferase [Vibrio fluvialis]MBY8249062.1 GNAT family N-acetyltransferase [Vibrio fluvialis]MBY8283037.1 GNAT family N-acetyltransferase [Vibrio fluvialis]MCE7586517.1 GNAT family N-acetyltransferase [Vibrio fluvialis]